MKAVNQSIGRCIRHRNDYAVMLLADQRYGKPVVHQRLPKWIASGVRVQNSVPQAVSEVRTFFNARAHNQRMIEETRRRRALQRIENANPKANAGLP